MLESFGIESISQIQERNYKKSIALNYSTQQKDI